MTFFPNGNTQPSLPGIIPPFTLPERMYRYPQLRLMGNKFRLLPWIGTTLSRIDFRTALDGFSGSGCVGYLMKCMGKSVVCNDFLNYASHVANALIANSRVTISDQELDFLLEENSLRDDFIARTFRNIFFSEADNEFLDNVWANLNEFGDSRKRSLVIAALCRSCIKKQPRGVFTTVTANNGKYRDGRRDLRLSLREHFVESVKLFNSLIFDNGQEHRALCSDIFSIDPDGYDLVYFDPPYVPRSDDNCYIKRYHFLEGLSCYWQGMEIVESSVVKKLKKRYTPFSYRRTSIEAFRDLFHRFRESVIVLSYSSNGYPDKEILLSLLREAKGSDNVFVETEPHTYHFGTHGGVNPGRKHIQEYLFIGA